MRPVTFQVDAAEKETDLFRFFQTQDGLKKIAGQQFKQEIKYSQCNELLGGLGAETLQGTDLT